MKINLDDTIAAISTAMGGGIGIVRLSGSDSVEILKRIFSSSVKEFESHRIYYGFIKDGEEIIDEVMVSVMLAPKSYTVEDVVEINCHGGTVSLNRVLRLCIEKGARLAEPGEFTKRAFLNGRIDLSKAEAVIDIINSKTVLSQRAAVNKLSGKIEGKINSLRNDILTMTAHLEAAIDYPEHDIEEFTYEKLKKDTLTLIDKIDELSESANTGKILKNGIDTVILGKPNVGKSSLLNAFLDDDRAIVTEIPGTTRDVLTESVNVKGIILNMIDTAGIRDTEDEIEKIGVEKSREYANKADLIFLVLDNSRQLSVEDKEILELCKDKKTIIIINKNDLESKLELGEVNHPVISISVKNDEGIKNIEDTVYNMFISGDINLNDDAFINSERNIESLNNAKKHLLNVIETIDNKMPEDFMSMDLLESYGYLGEIIGQSVDEDIIDKIFTEFCLGK